MLSRHLLAIAVLSAMTLSVASAQDREASGPALPLRFAEAEGAFTQSERALPQPLSRRTGWPGEVLRMEALDARGEVIGEFFVRDPRFIRYEGWTEAGEHEAGSNRVFIDERAPLRLEVAAPDLEGLAAIAVYEGAGSWRNPSPGRRLFTAPVRRADEEAR